MTDEPAATAAKKTKIDVPMMIAAIQSQADRDRTWADAVSDGNRAGLVHRADVLEAVATVVANAELAIEFARANAAQFRKWRDGRGASS